MFLLKVAFGIYASVVVIKRIFLLRKLNAEFDAEEEKTKTRKHKNKAPRHGAFYCIGGEAMKDKRIEGISRAGLYTRVSKEEQAKYGLSLDALNLSGCRNTPKKNGLLVVDVYTDAGHSARKSYKKRPEFVRMLEDVKAGNIDVDPFLFQA